MFIVDLWDSIFTPGTTPALITATHVSFILLIISLVALCFLSRSIHFINLLVIAVLLYGTVVWFIAELQKAKLESNQESTKPEATGTEEKQDEAEASARPATPVAKKRKT
ncbi:uncharacterized protein LODBEIA_P08150 [Lodderomyces beijingensis]|uniref:V-type ATPase assembly factor PKR1 n=1 Tax=Lodderomyces beijingensis TaxID=1775926 RepID=A0ABP0ZHK9_9ASCO